MASRGSITTGQKEGRSVTLSWTLSIDYSLKSTGHNPACTGTGAFEEYIRFRGALIELGKVGNAFTAELSNNELAFKENGQKIAYISNQSLVITNAEIRNKLSLGNETRGWFDFIPRANGNLSIKWRGPAT